MYKQGNKVYTNKWKQIDKLWCQRACALFKRGQTLSLP